MKKFLNSPLTRISIGLTMLTLSIVLIADLLGLVPNPKRAQLDARKTVAETLAVQVSQTLSREQAGVAEQLVKALVDRNNTVLSAAIRNDSTRSTISHGNHNTLWKLASYEQSTAEQVRVPIYRKSERWGSVEIVFSPLGKQGVFGNSIFMMLVYVLITGFLAYRFFLKRALQELNPDAVIPERVSSALDTLAEGLLIVDSNGMIVFSNNSFAKKTGIAKELLLGRKSSDLDWESEISALSNAALPWIGVLEGHSIPEDVTIRLKTAREEILTFAVNASPVMGEGDKIRGVLVTFDDISEVERKNEELESKNAKLRKIQEEINRQNEELQFLATRDPLTNALNRRSLFQGFDLVFADAKHKKGELSCLMVDIDHFKKVNDDYGHGVGDNVIKALGKVLLESSRPNDLVGRYGGEEFCIVLPDTDVKTATALGESMRRQIENLRNLDPSDLLRITSSFGVAAISRGVKDPAKLVDEADQALYQSKRNGRNKLTIWPCDTGAATLLKSVLASDIDEILSKSRPEEASIPQAAGQDINEAPCEDKVVDNNADGVETEMLPEAATDFDINMLSDRALIIDRIDQAVKHSERKKTQVAVLALSVDSLQKVNDTLGYRVGEKFISAVVDRLQETLRSSDTVILRKSREELMFSIARSSTDELLIVLTDLESEEIISGILQRIHGVFRDPVEAESMEFFLDLNIGISVSPQDGSSPNELIKNASSAMHQLIEKDDHHFFNFYDQKVNEYLLKRMQLETELHRAIERNELCVYYQPKVNLKSGEVTGFEALLRWNHPKYGTVMPDEFIPLAEQSGVISKIGQWVLRTACLQTRCWHKLGFDKLSIAVNLSPVEFKNQEFASEAISTITECGIAPELVELEITETAMIQNIDNAISIVQQITDAGIAVSIDDFGVGYSSLSYLQRFPLRHVKIDRSFIMNFLDNAHDGAIVSAIVAMGHSLGLGIIAEGVETVDHLRFLQDLSCDQAQGYLISKPMHHDKVPEFLETMPQIRHMIVDERQQQGNLVTLQQSGNMIGVINDLPMAGNL